MASKNEILGWVMVVGFLIGFGVVLYNATDKYMILVMGGFLVAYYQHLGVRKREINARFFDQKKELYSDICNLISNLFGDLARENLGVKKKEISPVDLAFKLLDIKSRLQLWADYSVIKAYFRIENISAETNDPFVMLGIYDDVLRAMRSDLGHDDSKMPKGQLASIFIVPEDRENIRKAQTGQS